MTTENLSILIRRQRDKVSEIDSQLKSLSSQLDQEKRALDNLENQCQHQWTKPVYVGTRTEGYYSPGDREMGIELGIDSRPGFHVPAREFPKWKKTCEICGKSITTEQTETVTTKVPKF